MSITGTEFESLTKPFFSDLFEKMGYGVLEVRNQNSGTQNGFDIKIIFVDKAFKERSLFIECKYYTSAKLDWAEIFTKQIELQASNYHPDGFILLSPRQILSNINDNAQIEFEKMSKVPVKFWTPDTNLEEIFALDIEIYEKVYDKPCKLSISESEVIYKTQLRIENILEQKDRFKVSNCISIEDTNRAPEEDDILVTRLDHKLNSVFNKDDEERLEYHKLRVNYKVYLEELQDVNNELRQKILKWQDNMRIKAKRLTKKYNFDPNSSAKDFYSEFFDIAEIELKTFYDKNDLKDDEEKLLNGIVFELAAECPLDWSKK